MVRRQARHRRADPRPYRRGAPALTDTGAGLREIARRDPGARSLRARYYERQGALHGECFYIGLCEPVDETELLIRETADYIEDARRLAAV